MWTPGTSPCHVVGSLGCVPYALASSAPTSACPGVALTLSVLRRRTVPYGLSSHGGRPRARRAAGPGPQSPQPPERAPRCVCADSGDRACVRFCTRAPAAGR